MNKLLENLSEYGADIDGTMERFLNDVDLYKHCFSALLSDDTFDELGKALSFPDYEKAFECAHTLKGVVGNMGLSPLYQTICNVCEALRNNEYANLQEYYEEIIKQLNLLKTLKE